MKKIKKVRQSELIKKIEDNPFVTDDELAKFFDVSVQTIRLDRMELSIPELRERIKSVAEQTFEDEVRSLPIDEVIGEIIDVELDDYAISIFDVQKEHVFQRNSIARGHHLFAQANSLAVALIDDDLALTAKAAIEFCKPVRSGQRVVSKARAVKTDGRRTTVEVTSSVGKEVVFKGEFDMYRSSEKGGE
ncbi:DeoR family transcriptional regulator [Jeotgalibacillus alimentarius]|uniref:Transcription factor FapR n=1 Tax=Jeotgalibacillus alimentarius TaxID=135826 RepID=A0A0C2S8Z8_9BACL|nr:transcription factor FapR [Jeotgalibacillus alimentarius]KIL50434.1 DeoR family transcriptional regulator [Jeotgalibacillus alimentarius]